MSKKNTKYKIEAGIIIPSVKSGGPRGNGRNQIQLRSMTVGDSCYIAKPQTWVSNIFGKVARDMQMKIVTRREGDGTRMWRTQ